MKTNIKNIKEACIAAFLIAIIVIRWKTPDENATWISTINSIGVIVAWGDLFYETCKTNKDAKNIKIFIVLSVIISIVGIIPFAGICTSYIHLNVKQNDTLTLVALLLTLSKNFFKELITAIIGN